ncbi:MAG: hypothetical protein FWH41_06340 [Treponema sp.]|nr:hypothetical protein [Treponema sp.]
MIAIDTGETIKWLINEIEEGNFFIDGRHVTEEDHKETSRIIAEYKAMRQKNEAKEAVLV